MFNKSLIAKRLTLWTTDELWLSQGRSYTWFGERQGGLMFPFNSKDSLCVYCANELNTGYSVVVTLTVDNSFDYRLILRPEDETSIRSRVNQINTTQAVFKPMRDYQRSKVYRWERATIDNQYDHAKQRLTDEEIAVLLADICQRFNLTPLSFIVTSRRQRTSCYRRGQLVLAEGWGRSKRVVLHEAAHHLAKGDLHKADFVSAVVRLYSDYLNIQIEELLENVRNRRIDFSRRFLTD